MTQLIIRNQGFKRIYLTRTYNSLATFTSTYDDIGFNSGTNDFNDYCLTGGCADAQNDKIKILSLPDKGRLYYITNPAASNPIYQNVSVGQMIKIKDLTENKILRFCAEGSSDQEFTGNYVTQFTFERYCGNTPSNIIVETKLNMLDAKIRVSAIIVPLSVVCQGIPVPGPVVFPMPPAVIWCFGWKLFSVSDYFGSNTGFIRMKINGATTRLTLRKSNGNPLNLNEILSVTFSLEARIDIVSNLPGYPSPPPAIYTFEYSIDGVTNWSEFTIQLKRG
ncbi:hypothetical protein [uncultured Chryseobacterium sp.]|uniref:hypothetical protein n=1 Tax=uncultured Chryseobacterium sp. TaxID=259322 RepID=UPI0025EEA194|nr:hypothetical protein [uncultured Chryseobacterium sp.]